MTVKYLRSGEAAHDNSAYGSQHRIEFLVNGKFQPAIEKAGIKFASVHTDPERMAWSAIWSARLMGFDCVVVPYDMTMESESRGAARREFPLT